MKPIISAYDHVAVWHEATDWGTMPDIQMGAFPTGPSASGNPTFGPGSSSGGAGSSSSGGGGGYKPIPVTGTGPQAAMGLAQQASGRPYDYGGTGSQGRSYDCSGFMSSLYGAYTGQSPTQRHFTTTSNFPSLGFQPGYQDGAFNIGVNPQPGMSGHMAGTLPNGVNVEAGGPKDMVQYGGSAAGAQHPQFSQQWHLPISSTSATSTSPPPGNGY
jgi:hypothetical protein